jgi:hypothetical protein
MDKKGMGFKAIVVIVLLLVTFGIFLIWQIGFGKDIIEETGSTKCQISILQAGSLLGKLKGSEVPNLPGCERIPVEIKFNDKNDIIKELLDKVSGVSKEFCDSDLFTRLDGRYCRKRYHPISFEKKNIEISSVEFEKYLKDNPVDLKCGFLRPKEGINTNFEYSVLYVADFSESIASWGEWLYLGSRYEAEKENIALIQTDKISDLNCVI